MPRPAQGSQRYVPGLDGIRAIAVLCVIAYHVNLPGAKGGLLGVGVFFTLSGYLITDLLISHRNREGNLGLRTFWIRRARRLLPALFVMLIVISVWVALFDASQLAAMRQQVYAAAGYFSNWYTIAQQGSYFARFAGPLPLDHLWSLAIEEQFYLLWPWLLLLGMWVFRGRGRLAVFALIAAGASALAMGLLYHPGADPTRVYEGTDTRAFGLLLGVVLAMIWRLAPTRQVARLRAETVHQLDFLGTAGLVCVLLLVWTTDAFSSFLYPTGFLLLALATAVMIAAAVNPVSRLGAALGSRPLRWIGVRSYGMYLWQWPVIVLISHGQTGFHPAKAILAVGVTVVVSALSWRYVEEPVRRGALVELRRRARAGASQLRSAAPRTVALAGVACLALPALALAGGLPVLSRGGTASPEKISQLPGALAGTSVANQPAAGPNPNAATRTACRSVIYIGDSTSDGEVSTDYIPKASLRLPAQLADVGVTDTIPEISGARAIVESFQGLPGAVEVAQQHLAQGYDGCWILALGTNDVDNVHDGAPIGFPGRITKMMSIIGRQPVMWVDTITLLPSDNPYAEASMQRWNQALLAACPRYPNMRVFDWASWAKRKWFIPDGIHYYSPGYVARTHRIAQGLAHAFPDKEPPNPSCVVR
jgi:peptidoglycan/LPS O-acetylase OafA/YrhL